MLVGNDFDGRSELLSQILQRKGVAARLLLNAKYHEREAEIVAQAGRARHGHHRHQHGWRVRIFCFGGNADFVAKQDLVKRVRRARLAQRKARSIRGCSGMSLLLPGAGIETSQENWIVLPRPMPRIRE